MKYALLFSWVLFSGEAAQTIMGDLEKTPATVPARVGQSVAVCLVVTEAPAEPITAAVWSFRYPSDRIAFDGADGAGFKVRDLGINASKVRRVELRWSGYGKPFGHVATVFFKTVSEGVVTVQADESTPRSTCERIDKFEVSVQPSEGS